MNVLVLLLHARFIAAKNCLTMCVIGKPEQAQITRSVSVCHT